MHHTKYSIATGICQGGEIVWITVLKVALCLIQGAFDLAVALYLMAEKED
jgi:hypothetical protein